MAPIHVEHPLLSLIDMMVQERNRMHDGSALRYHIELVKLLAYCTMGKNVFTEIKCHSLLPLDDVVKMVSLVLETKFGKKCLISAAMHQMYNI